MWRVRKEVVEVRALENINVCVGEERGVHSKCLEERELKELPGSKS